MFVRDLVLLRIALKKSIHTLYYNESFIFIHSISLKIFMEVNPSALKVIFKDPLSKYLRLENRLIN